MTAAQWFFILCGVVAVVILVEAVDLHMLWRKGKTWMRRDRWK